MQAFARGHPVFRRQVCVRLGRALRGADTRFKLWALQLPQPRALAPLSEPAALDAGADMLGASRVGTHIRTYTALMCRLYY